jgi:hypothetical protein
VGPTTQGPYCRDRAKQWPLGLVKGTRASVFILKNSPCPLLLNILLKVLQVLVHMKLLSLTGRLYGVLGWRGLGFTGVDWIGFGLPVLWHVIDSAESQC